MCFFHVAAKIHERTRHLPSALTLDVMRGLQDMHVTRSAAESTKRKEEVVSCWRKKLELATFVAYFEKQWLTGKFDRGQCFHTLRGFATTNNPVEQFNRALKGDHTLHRRLKMGLLFARMSACCKQESINRREFATQTAPTSDASSCPDGPQLR